MSFLLDTNVLSELRKGARADGGVRSWVATTPASAMWISVLTLGEIRRGVEALRRRDPVSAEVLEAWLRTLSTEHIDRVIPIDAEVAERWGHLNVPDPMPSIDGLLAATALAHDLTVVTRNTRDFQRAGVRTLNPFTDAPSAQ